MSDPQSFSPPLQLLTALWTLWQSLAASGAARLREECGVDLKGFIALSYLQARPYQPAELAEVLGLARYDISRLLGTLEAQGLIERQRTDTDGRQVRVRLTERGHDAWQRGLHTAERVAEPFLSSLGAPQRQELIHTLMTLARTPSQENVHDPVPSP